MDGIEHYQQLLTATSKVFVSLDSVIEYLWANQTFYVIMQLLHVIFNRVALKI